MITFTHLETDPYKKMEIMIKIKNYISSLIRNTRTDNIAFFSNIELGKDYLSPHIHCQFFYTDYNQLIKIRDKVFYKFGLFSEFSHTTIPTCKDVVYNYCIKDYSKSKTDIELLYLDEFKRMYRAKLGKNIRFMSMSKDKYTKAIYRKAYSKGIKRENVDFLITNCIINEYIELVDCRLCCYLIHILGIYIEQEKTKVLFCFLIESDSQFHFKKLFDLWVTGYL
jgi:hypothetical protein